MDSNIAQKRPVPTPPPSAPVQRRRRHRTYTDLAGNVIVPRAQRGKTTSAPVRPARRRTPLSQG